MRKLICLLLSLLCLVMAGCRSAGPVAQPSTGESSTPVDTNPPETTQSSDATDATVALPGTDSTTVALGQTGKLRIPFTTVRSGVRYVTDPSQLPDYPELEAYDEAYFRDHALLLVTETVTSGSVKVEIRSVAVENGIAAVTLDHEIPTGLGTADMATWLLWAEVDAGLEFTWNLENPALKSQTEQNELY